VSPCGTLSHELRKQSRTRKHMVLVPLFDLKFLSELAAGGLGTSIRRHYARAAPPQGEAIMASEGDNAGVIALPPLIFLVTFAAGLVLDRLVPIGAAAAMMPRSWRIILGGLLLLIGGWIALRAMRTFGRVGTPVDVRKTPVALATGDIFTRTRNPMYE